MMLAASILQHILGLSGLQILLITVIIVIIHNGYSYYYVLTFINYQIFFIRLLLVLIIIIAAIMIFGSSLNPANPIQQKLEKKSWEKNMESYCSWKKRFCGK